MGWSKGWRVWARRSSVVVCGWALFALPAVAQPAAPQAPLKSDIALRLLPVKSEHALSPEVMKEQPLFRVISEGAATYFGFDMVDGLGQAFDGTVVASILSNPGGGSSLFEFFKDDELRGERESLVVDMRGLASDLESYKTENDAYPEDYRKFIDEYRYYEPYMPEGVSYDYQRTEGGKGFRLVVKFGAPSRLGELGPAPIFTQDGGEENATASKPRKPVNFVLGAKVADVELAKQIAGKLIGESKDGFWVSDDQPPLIATLRGPWLVVSDNKANLGPFLKSLNGEAPTLAKNPGYQTVARNINMNAPFTLFVDLPHLLETAGLAETAEEKRLLKIIGPMGYALTPTKRYEMRMEAFTAMRPPQGSELAKLFNESGKARTESELVASNIPWDVSNAFAFDYQRCKALLNATVALSAEARESMGLVEDVWAGFLGLDAEAGFDRLVDGWVVLSFERLDIFVNAFEEFAEAMTNFPSDIPDDVEETGGPLSEEQEVTVQVDTVSTDGAEETTETTVTVEEEVDGDAEATVVVEEVVTSSETPIEESATEAAPVDTEETTVEEEVIEVDKAPAKPPRLPFTVAFKVGNEQTRSVLLEALAGQLGEAPTTQQVYGVDVTGRQDGLLSYALRDDWFYVSGGKTQRLLRNLLAAATGNKENLTSLDTWSRFKTGQKGQVLAIGHQKVDAFYSVVKGFLLFLGPDFRPLATEMGGLRDSHSAVFLVPDGVRAVGDILQGDGK